jgi:subtilisin family serine protease
MLAKQSNKPDSIQCMLFVAILFLWFKPPLVFASNPGVPLYEVSRSYNLQQDTTTNSSEGSENGNSEPLQVPNRGERPIIHLNNLKADAMVQGVVLIKFREEWANHIELNGITKSLDSTLIFHIAGVDSLNKLHRASNISQFFSHPHIMKSFSDKHKKWGFHLWYKFQFDPGSDIVAIASHYANHEAIESAMPEFKKSLIQSDFIPFESKQAEKQDTVDKRATMPNDFYFEYQWPLYNDGAYLGTPGADISMPEAWDIQRGNSNVIVAIIDAGIDIVHPDLSANIWTGVGYNFVNSSTVITPGVHGTHVAGTVAALTNNAVGVAGIAGGYGSTGTGARLMSCQVFNADGTLAGGFHLAPVWAADQGAAISQNSWGYDVPDVYDIPVLDAIDYFNAEGGGSAILNGGLTFFAAGNSTSGDAYYPAYYSGAISVAATNYHDVLAFYSNFGEWVDISAPGGEIIFGGGYDDFQGVLSTTPDSTYSFSIGTSMACPHVSGVAALIASEAYGQLEATTIRDILLNTVDDIYHLNPNYTGMLGTGRLNAFDALLETVAFTTGVPNPFYFNAFSTDTTTVELSWTPTKNNPVLLVYNSEGQFGVPSGNYNPGDVVNGGGTVIYAGSDTSFIHSGLMPGSPYYYKLFSFQDTNYSTGTLKLTYTECQVHSSFPFFESFESTTSALPCWSISRESGNGTWVQGVGSFPYFSPLVPFHGSYNIICPPTASLSETKLVSPVFDLTSLNNPELSFWFVQEDNDDFIYFPNNELRVYYRSSPANSWVLLYENNQAVQNWTNVVLSLPGPSTNYQIAFEGVSDFDRFHSAIDLIEVRDETILWAGQSDSNWHNPSNWNPQIPDGTSDIAVKPSQFYPNISDLATIDNLTLYPGTSLNVGNSGRLTIQGETFDFTALGGITLTSGQTASASLLHYQGNLKATYNQTINDGGWHMMSSPVKAQPVEGTENGGFLDGGSVFAWHEAAQSWVSYANNTVWPDWDEANNGENYFLPAHGYLFVNSDQQSHIRSVSGELNEGEQVFPVSAGSGNSELFHGFNLAGNPYPSSVDWGAANGWGRESLNQVAADVYQYWVWNPIAMNYGTCLSNSESGTLGTSRFIAPFQAFWVEASSAGSLTMANSIRAHSDQPWLKQNQADHFDVRVSVYSHEYKTYDEIVVRLNHGSNPVSASRLGSLSEKAPALFVSARHEEFSIVQFDTSPEIPVSIGFRPAGNGYHSLRVNSPENMPYHLLLEDLEVGNFSALNNENGYEFMPQINAVEPRFKLHFSAVGDNEYSTGPDKVFISDRKLMIKLDEERQAFVGLYDIAGRYYAGYQVSGMGMHELPLPANSPLWVVRLMFSNSVATYKLFSGHEH